jgi:hypothetical protein
MSDLKKTAEKILEDFKKNDHTDNSGELTIKGPGVDFKAVMVKLRHDEGSGSLFVLGIDGNTTAAWILDISRGGHHVLEIGPTSESPATLSFQPAHAQSGEFIIDTDDDFTFAIGSYKFLANKGGKYEGAFDIKPVKSSS